MPERRKRPMTERHEAAQEPARLLAKGRRKAKATFEAVKPQIRSFTQYSANLATKVYGKTAFQLLDALADDSISPEDWLGDVTALAIGHWLKPLEALAQRFNKKQAPAPTKDPHFVIDQKSQAADPVAIDVSEAIHLAVKEGRVVPEAIDCAVQTIPAENIRYTVSEGITYISLVGLEGVGLQPANLQGPISIRILPAGGVGAVGLPIAIGTAHMTVGGNPVIPGVNA